MAINSVILSGRITRDAEIKGDGDKKRATYTLAVDRGKDAADFVPCVCFGKTADFAEKFCKQGQKFVVSGKINSGNYEKEDGAKVYYTNVVVHQHDFAGGKASDGQSAPAQPQQTAQAAQPQAAVNENPDGFTQIPEGEEGPNIPFEMF